MLECKFISLGDPTVEFSSILNKVNKTFKKPIRMLMNECECYCVFNLRKMSVLVETWVISSSVSSHRVSLRAQVLIGSFQLYSKYYLTIRFLW